MTSFQWFLFVIAFAKFVRLSLVSFSKMSQSVLVGRPLLQGLLDFLTIVMVKRTKRVIIGYDAVWVMPIKLLVLQKKYALKMSCKSPLSA